MNYTEFKQAVKDLGNNLDEMTMMDAYATYEVTNCTIEAAVEETINQEIY